jgi:hypothetical protein
VDQQEMLLFIAEGLQAMVETGSASPGVPGYLQPPPSRPAPQEVSPSSTLPRSLSSSEACERVGAAGPYSALSAQAVAPDERAHWNDVGCSTSRQRIPGNRIVDQEQLRGRT